MNIFTFVLDKSIFQPNQMECDGPVFLKLLEQFWWKWLIFGDREKPKVFLPVQRMYSNVFINDK